MVALNVSYSTALQIDNRNIQANIMEYDTN